MSHAFPLAALPVPLVYATHRIIRDCNDAFAAQFGYERGELIDTSFSKLYPEIEDFIRTGRMWRANLAGGTVYRDERIMKSRQGERFWCRVRGRSLHPSDPFAEAIYCFEPLRPALRADGAALTGRQRQIVALVAQGRTNREIAAELGLSPRSVETLRARLMKSLGLRNGPELIAWFLERDEKPEPPSPS